MKIGLVICALIMSVHTALACTNPEAQYKGVVSDYYGCSFKIRFTEFTASAVCGLDIEEAASTRFNDASCSLKEKDQVAGYLVVKNGVVVID